MMHKAWSSIEEVPYCFWRSSVKFQGHTALKSVEFDPDLCRQMASLGPNELTYCIHHCSDWGRIKIRVWTHKVHPIPRPNRWAMGSLFGGVCSKLTTSWWHCTVLYSQNNCKVPFCMSSHDTLKSLRKTVPKTSQQTPYIDGLVQERSNSIANELELCLSCTNL